MSCRVPLVLLLATSCYSAPGDEAASGSASESTSPGNSGLTTSAVDPTEDTSTGAGTSGAWTTGGEPDTTGMTWATGMSTAGTSDTSGIAESSSTSGDTSGGGLPEDCPRVKVTVAPGDTLNVRPTPSTAGEPVGALDPGAIVDAVALVQGEAIDGNDLWFEISSDEVAGFVSAKFVECTTETPPDLDPPDEYWLPLACGKSAKVSQGNFGDFSHQGKASYAFDFAIPVGTPMVAMADGIVLHTFAETMPGEPCYDGGGPECFPFANLVVLLHGDGATTLYKHLSEVLVVDGEFVPRAGVVGLSGSTGYSTGPHAHSMRMEDCGANNCQSIPLAFADVAGDGVPNTGEMVTSMNCP